MSIFVVIAVVLFSYLCDVVRWLRTCPCVLPGVCFWISGRHLSEVMVMSLLCPDLPLPANYTNSNNTREQ